MTAAWLTFGLASGLVLAGHSAQAQQFSANLVSSNAAGDVASASGRIYVSDGKVRIETPDLPGSFLVVDSVVPAAYLVRPRYQVFMEAKQSSQLTQLFVSLDPSDPCPQWQAMAEVAGIFDRSSSRWHCDPDGRETTVEGRNTMKFKALFPNGSRIGWIDPELKFPVKIRS